MTRNFLTRIDADAKRRSMYRHSADGVCQTKRRSLYATVGQRGGGTPELYIPLNQEVKFLD